MNELMGMNEWPYNRIELKIKCSKSKVRKLHEIATKHQQ